MIQKVIQKYPIWSFLIINYTISWSFLYPSYQIILKNDGITPLALIGLIGAYGPSIAALVVQYIIDDKKLKPLLKRLIQFRSDLKTILFVIFAPILFYIVAYLFSLVLFNEDVDFNWFFTLTNIPTLFLMALPFGPMGEELGWRGFMLPKLLAHNSIMRSTFYVGLAWGIWHCASFTFPGAALPSFFNVTIWSVLLYFFNTIALSFVFTYVYLNTNGSVFYAILLHAFFNASSGIALGLLGETGNTTLFIHAYLINIILAGLCGFLLIKNKRSY